MAKRKQRKRKPVAPKRNPRRTAVIISAVVLGVIGLGYLLYLGLQPAAAIAGLVNFGRQTRGHDDVIQIESGDLPPVGGTHNPAWQNCGIYTEPVRPENAVHSLEHGAAWITYQPDLAADEVAALQDFVRGQTFIILSPYPGLRSPVMATAWSVQIELESAEDGRLADFIDRYRLGPTTPELGATCSDGIGAPLS